MNHPCTIADVGQMEINASIAQRPGFTVDPAIWHLMAYSVDEDGKKRRKVIDTRKTAYYIPQPVRYFLFNDEGLVEYGRALQKKKQAESEED